MSMFNRLARICATVALCCTSVIASTPNALAAGDANEAACPNEALEGFRDYLPDCRAYEMVTPAFKDGAGVDVQAVSSDSSHVLVSSLGAFAGAEGDANFGEGATYLLSRSAHGWETSSVAPPVWRFPAQIFKAATADAEASLWFMRTPEQSQYAEDAYVREADGSFVRLGPLIPPAAEAGPPAGAYEPFFYGVKYATASSNLSHMVFELATETPLWPGDTTYVPPGGSKLNRSLYELVEGGSRPELVGVDDRGELVSDCETDLGSSRSLDVYNAMSADGETVFFTAATDASGVCPSVVRAPEVEELYARLGGVETVAISEPAATACTACDVPATVAEGRRSAEFAGASENGSKVFFLTEQALLGSDTSMNLYEYDLGALPGGRVIRVTATTGGESAEVQGVARVSEDGSHVYFVARGVLTQGPNAEGREPVKSADNLYVYERDATYPAGRLAFVATLCSGPGESGTVSGLAQCPSAGAADKQGDAKDWGKIDNRLVDATPDGRFLVFESVADLTPGDTSSEPQVFEYDAQTGELVRVSTGQAGYASGLANANAHPSTFENSHPQYSEFVLSSDADARLSVSNDGSTVGFESAGALAPEAEPAAAAGATSVYEYHSHGPIADGNVYLISDGASTRTNNLMTVNASGDDIFFKTAASLVGSDTDTQEDLYDARVDGGFPSSPAAPACAGEGCQGETGTPSAFGFPASATIAGSAPLTDSTSPAFASPKPKSKPPLTRAQKLAKALQACRKDRSRARRKSCEAGANKGKEKSRRQGKERRKR